MSGLSAEEEEESWGVLVCQGFSHYKEVGSYYKIYLTFFLNLSVVLNSLNFENDFCTL